MSPLHSLSILLSLAALSAWLNYRYLKLPSAIGVMSISLLFSLIIVFVGQFGLIDISFASSFVRVFDFEQLLLHGMLAFLLFAGGLSVDLGELNSQRTAIAILSTVGVACSALLTGLLFSLMLGLIGIQIPFVMALLFGTIVAPTDPVAILGILRKVGAPKSLEIKIVGESLFNDGVGVVMFFAVSTLAFGSGVTFVDVIKILSIEVIGGASLGLLLGWICYRMLKSTDEYVVEILLTLALATGGYALAETLHVSAPICVVVAGLIIGNHGRSFAMSQKTKLHLDTFWELIDELLNAVLFVLIGLEILLLAIRSEFIFAGLFAIAAVLVSRFISVWIPILFLGRWQSFTPHVVKILAWGGLKGGISVALALSLPTNEFRELMIMTTYIVVLFSVLVQGTTLPMLLRFSKKRGD